jgi:Tol biopolymer transport system component
MADKQLAHYSIIEKVGEGGMGEVFRAHDTRLGRDVALKFLPESLATDADRLARFEREARLLAALNHPHIAAIHGFEHVEGKRFLVLEMVEGEDLSQRLVRGPLRWQEALPICQQIAEALEAAHEESIVHRDLKPANILLTPSGNAKVLDFGLAKAWEAESANTSLTNSPTVMASSPTVAGVILGTAGYMSPEQARGQVVDKRADIFAFGCVLFEMLTAQQCFGGKTVSDTLAAVLRAEPDWNALPKDTPQAIVKLLRRCLDKEVNTRLRDIGEARIVIDGVLHGDIVDESPAVAAAAVAPARKAGTIIAWSLVGVLAITAGVTLNALLKKEDIPARVMRTSILPAEKVRFNLRGIHPGPITISPNGERIAYAGLASGGAPLLYVRDLNSMETRSLRGTDGAGYPFWSPDGRSIGFFAAGKLKRVDVGGGPPLTLCEAPVGKGGSWRADGTILFAPTFTGPLHVVSEAGGATTPVTELRSEDGENSHRFPRFLPDGEHFIYLARLGGEANMLRVGSLSGDVDKEVLRTASHAEYASGYMLFMRESTLLAREFDLAKLECVGDPIPVADPVRYIPAAMRGVFSVSNNGMLIYQAGSSVPGAQLVWRDLNGKELARTGDTVMEDNPVISPDGKFVAVNAFVGSGGTSDVWIYDVERNIRTRFTFDPASDESAVWSPDSKQIAFSSARNNMFGIYVKDVGGATNAQLLMKTDGLVFPTHWSPDGKYIVYFETDSMNTGNIMAVPTRGDIKPFAVVATPYGEYTGKVSSDAHWMTYISDESGVIECYVTSFPKAGRKWQISTGGGSQSHWDPKGKGLYYFGADSRFYFVEARWDASSFAIGQTTTMSESITELGYQVAPDGERLLVLEDADEGSVAPLTLVTGWVGELEARADRR